MQGGLRLGFVRLLQLVGCCAFEDDLIQHRVNQPDITRSVASQVARCPS